MNKQTKIGIVFIVLLLVVLMVWFLGNPKTGTKSARRPYVSSNWDVQFKLMDKDPYGLFLFNQLLRAHVDSAKNVQPITDGDQLDSVLAKKNKVTMLFVGNKFGLQNRELDTIMLKVNSGSDLFLSYSQLTDNLIERFFKTYEVKFDYADSVNVFINKNKFAMYYLFQNDTIAYEWKAFYNIEPFDSIYASLSSFMEMSDFIRLKHGKGFIYLHTNPEFFFNYQLKREQGYRYTSFALNQLSKENDLYLLELGRLLDGTDDSDQYDAEVEGGNEDSSYLKFLLKSPSFMAAMGLTLLGLFLFLIFRSKRMQPIVPFISKKKNMSLSFAETITSIYLSKQNPVGILQVQRKNFYDAVYKHFFVDISRRTEDRQREIRIFSEKSTIPEAEIIELIDLFEPKNASNINDDYIINLAKKQRAFYLQTGMISAEIIRKVEGKLFTCQRNLWISYLLILGGLYVVILGFYYLVNAIGIGIALWPIGAFILALGIRRLSTPLVSVDKDSITFYPLFAKKKIFAIDDLLHITRLRNGYLLTFKENKEITITKLELSSFDKTQFERFISKHHQLEV